MSTTIIYCRFEPGNFPTWEFMQDAEGNVIFPFVHKVTKPYHYTNGAYFYSIPTDKDTDGEGEGTRTNGEQPPDIPIPPTYIPITPQMMPEFSPELEKFIHANPKANLEEYIEFGETFGLTTKEFNLEEMIQVNQLDIVIHKLDDRATNQKTLKNIDLMNLGYKDLPGKNIKFPGGLDKKGRGGFGGPGGMGGTGGFGGL